MRWSVLLLLASLGCASRSVTRATTAPYASITPGPTTRVMLVAGGDDVANFAEEVVRQRRMWQRAGVDRDDIACYWAKPSAAALRADRRQYASLDADLASCGAASAEGVLDDIEAVAATAPDYFYLYVTAHGVASLGGDARTWVLPPDEREFLAQPALALDADRSVRVGDTHALLSAWRDGSRPRDRIALTPAALRAALSRFPAGTRKIVVLQGCFSGAFLGGPESLAGVPNTTVLTAAAANRPSFGCGSGTRETFWGGALGRELGDRVRRGVTPDRLPWHEVHLEVARRVRLLERTLGQRPSKPQFGACSAFSPCTGVADAVGSPP